MARFVTLLRRPVAAVVLLAIPAAMLAGCGESRDEVLAEKVARAENAAERADKAQQAAEHAARSAGARYSNSVIEKDEAPPPVGDETQAAPIDTANASSEQNTDLAAALNGPAN